MSSFSSSLSRVRESTFSSLPTVVVFVLVVLAGSRLMYLSVQRHASIAHDTAAAVVADFVAKLEPPLASLADFAADQARGAARPPPRGARIFWMAGDHTVLRAAPGQQQSAAGIAGEWQSAESIGALPSSAILGPMRLGSQWIVAARAADSSAARRGKGETVWAVAYATLDDLIVVAHLGGLTSMGYDFQLSENLPRGAQSRLFITSSTVRLTDTVAAQVRFAAPTLPGRSLELAIRPHAGWYPSSLLAAEIGLLGFLAWLLAFGTHDVLHALQRSGEALKTARRRLHAVNQQLATEIQQRTTLQETFAHALFHDAFTGLPNRRYFMDRLDRALRDLRKKQRAQLAVFIVDITRFKLVNDLLGHTAGDELMVQAARRFEKLAGRFEAVLARWGGDQFALLVLQYESTAEAVNMGSLLREELRSPFDLRRHQLVVAASVGITCTDSGQQRAEDVVREADIALSVAKRSEESKVVLYAPDMRSQAATLVSLEADLHIALEKGQMQLVMQPVVDLRTYKMVGAEALLRWRHPVESVLAPDRFLSIAEDAGLMVPITRWIILRTLKTVALWRRRLPAGKAFYISINLSPTALRDPELATYVGTLLREMEIPAKFIKFEVSEGALTNNVGAAREALELLHGLGIGLMLDDFGTGFTSLSNLQLFPFDFVKIERPFVNFNNSDRANTGMMAAMVQMAASLKLTAIAETIESKEAATALQQMGCEFGQGYYFSEPIDAEAALGRLSSQEPFQPRDVEATTKPSAWGNDLAETRMLPPLAEDTSATRMLKPLTDEAAEKRILTPLDEDTSATRFLMPLAADAAATPEDGTADSSPTIVTPPLLHLGSAPVLPQPEENFSIPEFVLPGLDTVTSMTAEPLDPSPTAILPPILEFPSMRAEESTAPETLSEDFPADRASIPEHDEALQAEDTSATIIMPREEGRRAKP